MRADVGREVDVHGVEVGDKSDNRRMGAARRGGQGGGNDGIVVDFYVLQAERVQFVAKQAGEGALPCAAWQGGIACVALAGYGKVSEEVGAECFTHGLFLGYRGQVLRVCRPSCQTAATWRAVRSRFSAPLASTSASGATRAMLGKMAKNAQGHEYYASLRTRGAIDAAEICIFMIDCSQPVSEQDQRVLNMILDAGKALILVFNKWDLMDENRRWELDREIDQQLAHIPWVKRINISAKTGRALQRIEPYMLEALESWDKRITTGQLNNWLRTTVAQNPPPMKGGRIPKILFATQASTRPPVIVLFTTGFLDAGYRRYLERKFREAFGFEGSPVKIAVRVRERRPTKK